MAESSALSAAPHPARFSDEVLEVLRDLVPPGSLVLDPFAGTGRIHEIAGDDVLTIGVEIEPEWACWHERTVVADALHLPEWWTGLFDVVVTSPVYGNRMSDHQEPAERCSRCLGTGTWPPEPSMLYTQEPCEKCEGKGFREYTRISYRHKLGRPLHPNNAGQLQWGSRYRNFHAAAWAEVDRVLAPGGRFVLNVSDHVRGGQVQLVTAWHVDTVEGLGLRKLKEIEVPTRRMRFGQNHEARVKHESVVVFEKE